MTYKIYNILYKYNIMIIHNKNISVFYNYFFSHKKAKKLGVKVFSIFKIGQK